VRLRPAAADERDDHQQGGHLEDSGQQDRRQQDGRDGERDQDVTATDVMRLVHGIAVATEQVPDQADRLLSLMLDGLRARPGA
jgi:hypothetical protein